MFFKQGIPRCSCQVIQQDIKLLKIFKICNFCRANYVFLPSEQRNIFQDQGFILLEIAIDTELWKDLQNDFNGWIKDRINHQ